MAFFVAGGDSQYGEIPCLAYSSDGLSWTTVIGSEALTEWVYCIACNGDMWIAACNNDEGNSMLYSYDGVNWTGMGIVSALDTRVGAVAWSTELEIWVAVGAGSCPLAYSYNGLDWIGVSLTGTNGNMLHYSSVFSKWFAGISGYMYSSVDGISWSPVTDVFTQYLYDMATRSGRAVAVGLKSGTTIEYSDDGASWSSAGTPFGPYSTNAVDTDGSRFVVAAQGTSNIGWSDDGVSWTGLGYIFTDGADDIMYDGSRWFACGSNYDYGDAGDPDTKSFSIKYSDDGKTWSDVTNDPFMYDYEITWPVPGWTWWTECFTICYNAIAIGGSAGHVYVYRVALE